MCNVNHPAFTRPGYLIDTSAESIAPPALFTRMLANHAEVGLTGEQIRGLLDLSREYHGRQVTIRLRLAELAEAVELKRGRLTSSELGRRKVWLDERAELFRDDESLFFEYAEKGQNLLSDEQIAIIDLIYHSEKDEGLSMLSCALNNAVGPTFVFRPADQPASDTAA